jgi:hypothetical protein
VSTALGQPTLRGAPAPSETQWSIGRLDFFAPLFASRQKVEPNTSGNAAKEAQQTPKEISLKKHINIQPLRVRYLHLPKTSA